MAPNIMAAECFVLTTIKTDNLLRAAIDSAPVRLQK